MTAPRRLDSRSQGYLIALALALSMAAAFFVRVHYRSEAVFAADQVRFQGNDAWYHARLVDNLIANFPRPLGFDPLTRFPGGEPVRTPPLFDLLIAGTSLAIGGGAPSPRLVERVAAYMPPVLGALTLLPAFFVGRRVFGTGAGLLGAAVLAVLPGQFLMRGALGYTDHHVAETALTTLVMLFVIEAIARPRASYGWSVAAGLVLALYFLTWSGASLFVAILVAWAVLQIVIDHLTGPWQAARESGYRPPALVLLPALVVPLLVVLLVRRWLFRSEVSLIALAGGIAIVAALALASRALAARRLSRWWILAAALAPPVAVAALIALAAPTWLEPWTARLGLEIGRLTSGTRAMRTVTEATGLFPEGVDPWRAWLQFASGSFLAPLALAQLSWRTWKEPRAERVLFVVWTITVIAATLGQVRFGYYAAVTVSLLTGAAAATVVRWGTSDVDASTRQRLLYGAMAVAAVVLLVFVPCVRISLPLLATDEGPSAEWLAALDWLRESTPAPFTDAEYLTHHDLDEGTSYRHPSSAYGVLNWWDHGYLIQRRARRIPTSNPTQSGATASALFLLEQDPRAARSLLAELGARYVIVDRTLLLLPIGPGVLAGRFHALPTFAGLDDDEFVARYWARSEDGELAPVSLLRPAYYRTMLARLYLFRGEAFEPRDSTWLVASRPERHQSGTEIRVVTDVRKFASWSEASEFLAEHPAESYEVMGRDPMASCVPLERLDSLRQVYPTAEAEGEPAVAREVRIFAL